MVEHDLINSIYSNQEKEIKNWVIGGFVGSHHWRNRNYIPMIMYPILFASFLIFSFLFGYEIINNINSMMNTGGMDLTAFSSNPNYIEDELLGQVLPLNYFYLLSLSIGSVLIWWIVDLYLIEKKYKKQLKRIVKKEEPKSIFVAYLLWLLIGAFGAHRFYAGKFNTGVAFVFLTLTSWTVISSIILFIWYMHDAFLLKDYIIEKNKKILLDY